MKETHALAQEFYFEGFSIEPKQGRIVYTYTTDAGHVFKHELTLPFPEGVDIETIRPEVFALGMAELVHYWKAILAPKIIIKAGKLTPEQVVFWENLYTKGLGEFFYKNQFDFRGFIYVESSEDAPEIAPVAGVKSEKALVLFGGGKDSLVTAELLKAQKKSFAWFELEPLPLSKRLREASGTTETFSIGRDVAKNFAPIVELVKKGAPNGHVPITATYRMAAMLIAKLHGFRDIILSLERSADEGNVEYLGLDINHQYSKTLEFEKLAQDYATHYVNPAIRMFSLLRPLYELQIVGLFAQYPQYFPHFISCNKGLKTGLWCGECAKCAFMFSALSAFLPIETVIGIFKKNLFEDTSLIPLYKEMLGLTEVKPFDCIGTFEENAHALYLAGEQYKKRGMPLPPVLVTLPIEEGAKYPSLLLERGPHMIPGDYQAP